MGASRRSPVFRVQRASSRVRRRCRRPQTRVDQVERLRRRRVADHVMAAYLTCAATRGLDHETRRCRWPEPARSTPRALPARAAPIRRRRPPPNTATLHQALVLQGEIYTGDGICAGHGWCAASGDRSGWPLSGGGRQMPEFRGLSGRMGAVLARPSDFDSIGSTLAIFRLAGNGVGIVGCCRRQRIMDVKCDVADRRAFPIVGPGWCGISAWN